MKTDKKYLTTAKNYSNALIKIAKEQNRAEILYQNFLSVIQIFQKSKDLYEFLVNPLVSDNDKKEIIYKVFKDEADLQLINLMNLLIDNKRFTLIETVFYCFEKEYEVFKNLSKITVISAIELSEESKNRLMEILEKKLGEKVIPEYSTDKKIVGGLIIKMQDRIIDLSIHTKIKNMEKQLA